MSIQSFRDLLVWQKAMLLVTEVYSLSHNFPREELYGLTSQIRRATVSVPSNIAEGHQRGTKEFLHFLKIAKGSLAEMDTQLEIAFRLNYLQETQQKNLQNQIIEIQKMLSGLMSKLNS
uniref:four helix bundle protein n=1 Tax=Epilithonimonas tenax TaxID=191577 RepID=UPI0009715202|nr:four helix bundle protein [Epilithonimonas tenax]